MGLDRNELAARFAVADYGAKVATIYAGDPSKIGGATFYDDVADEAFKMADAFLDSAESIDARPVKSGPSAPVAPKSEAAKYEPRVGDVVELWAGSAKNIPWVVTDAESHNGSRGYVTLRSGIDGTDGCYRRDGVLYLRPATPAERSAAGLPSPEATRPTHVRIVKTDSPNLTEGSICRVLSWDLDGAPWVECAAYPECGHALVQTKWEPATPPAPVEPAKGGTVENMAAHLAWCAWCGTDDRSELPYDAFRAGYRTALAARGGS